MIRADETGRPRDFTLVAALVGLAWAAHPSATAAGPALVLFVVAHAKALGWRGVAWRTGLAALCAAGPSLALPALSARDARMAFGEPEGLTGIVSYVAGSRFTSVEGSWGFDAGRWTSVGQYFWEEMLLVGTLAVAAGLVRLATLNRRLLAGIALWAAPFLGVPVSFKLEGQHDHWFVAAWLALDLAAAVALWDFGRRARARAVPLVVGAGLAGVVWAAAINYPLLNQRGYDLPRVFGRIHLDALEPDAILMTGSDDTAAIGLYLQIVRGHREDVLLVRASHLGSGWYDRKLRRRDARLKASGHAGAAAFANENVSRERPVYFEVPPPVEMIRPDYALVPAGTLWKMAPKGEETIDPRRWRFPIEPQAVRARFRRARGQRVEPYPGGIRVAPEPYERRLLISLLRARKLLADWHFAQGGPEGYRQAQGLYGSIVEADPEAGRQAEVVYPYALTLLALGQRAAADPVLRRALELELAPAQRATALCYLGEIYRDAGRAAEAEALFRQALAVPGVDARTREEVERRAAPR
jgi:tetratricopeptide (TPR) repeat protein